MNWQASEWPRTIYLLGALSFIGDNGDDCGCYEITDFGVIHEIARGGSYGNLSMAVHIYDLGAWNFR